MSASTLNTKKHEIPQKFLPSLFADCKKPKDLIGEIGPLKQLAMLREEKALEAELTEHLGMSAMPQCPTSEA